MIKGVRGNGQVGGREWMGDVSERDACSGPATAMAKRLTSGFDRTLDLNGSGHRLRELREKRNSLEEQLIAGISLLRGSLVSQFKTCGKKNCHCQNGKKHGPFTYLSLRVAGRTKMLFIREADRAEVEELVGNYRDFRRVKAELAGLNREISRLLDGVEAARLCGGEALFLQQASRPQRFMVGAEGTDSGGRSEQKRRLT